MTQGSREEQRLEMMAALLERLPAAVAYLDGPEHRFAFANPAFVTLLGGRELIGRTAAEAVPEVRGQGYLELLDQVFATGEAAQGREADLWLRSDGPELRQVFVDFLCEPVEGDEDEVVGVLVHAVDVTSHTRDRRRLVDLTSEIDEAQERYRTLFETMLHGVVYHGRDGAIVAANPTAGEILGVGPADLIGLSPQGPRGRRCARTGRRSPVTTIRPWWPCAQARSWPTS